MRHISARYARPGMVLKRPVYDKAGILLAGPDTVLDEARLDKFRLYNVCEIIVEDPRVNDVSVQPLIGPELEAEAVRSLRDLVARLRGCAAPARQKASRRRPFEGQEQGTLIVDVVDY